MNTMRSVVLFIILLHILSPGCISQDKDLQNREPAAAGSYYAGDPKVLKNDLIQLFNQAQPGKTRGDVLAIIAPHAGYPYSGVVAASSYNQIDRDKKYENIFVIGSSHRVSYQGASIYNKGHYETPLGTVKVNLELANKLIDNNNHFQYYQQAHTQEHSLEVELPFLQHILKEDFRIVPILLGTHSPEVCQEISRTLSDYFNENNLFVISTDFSHYPEYESANSIDKSTAEAICSNSVENFILAINRNMEKNIPNLATCICAWPAVMTLLYMTQNDPEIEISLVEYRNSGDSEYGDKSQVVGYCAISVSKIEKTLISSSDNAIMNVPEFSLSTSDKKELLKIARNTLTEYIHSRTITDIDSKNFSSSLLTPAGAFVTLMKEGNLRGCIGRFNPEKPLYQVVQDMTISAATRDYRFTPVTIPEIKHIEIEISVLTPMKKIADTNEIELGKHGIYIKKGINAGTFLPQVATKSGWTKEEFLGHCARDKAMIGWDGWKDAEIYTYEALVFSEQEFSK